MDGKQQARIVLNNDVEKHVPDTDFVLLFSTASFHTPFVQISRSNLNNNYCA